MLKSGRVEVRGSRELNEGSGSRGVGLGGWTEGREVDEVDRYMAELRVCKVGKERGLSEGSWIRNKGLSEGSWTRGEGTGMS